MEMSKNKSANASAKEPAGKGGSAEAQGNSRDANKPANPTKQKNETAGK